jgi:hypothetical protein
MKKAVFDSYVVLSLHSIIAQNTLLQFAHDGGVKYYKQASKCGVL